MTVKGSGEYLMVVLVDVGEEGLLFVNSSIHTPGSSFLFEYSQSSVNIASEHTTPVVWPVCGHTIRCDAAFVGRKK